MNKAELQELKQKLVELQSGLEARLKDDEESSGVVELDQSRVGRLSRMDAMQAQEMALEAARRNRRQLARVQRALQRIESGDYGHCLECGEDVDPRRLAIDPAATHCIDCADQ